MNGDEEYYEGQEDVFTRLAQTEEVSVLLALEDISRLEKSISNQRN